MNRLDEILSTMDIPSLRKNTDNDNNLRWLLRNIRINNSNHPDIDEAVALIKKELLPELGE